MPVAQPLLNIQFLCIFSYARQKRVSRETVRAFPVELTCSRAQFLQAIKRLFRFRIFIKDNELVVLKGLFTRKVINIPINKIQSVHAVQSYLHRFTETCELKIETAGEENTEVEIKAIDREKAYALQELLKNKPATIDTIQTAEPETILGVGSELPVSACTS